MPKCRPSICNLLRAGTVLMAVAVTGSGALAAGSATNARPNILFCMADDWGWPHAGAYGDKVIKTPTFDRLAREGVLFEKAFVSSPSCTPSRNAILTGQQFYRLDQGANLWSTLDVHYPNFMFRLREAGYEIGHKPKAWGPGDPKRGGYTENPCGPKAEFAGFMEKRDKSRPFCFWLGTQDPHRGYRKGSGAQNGIDVDRVRVPGFFPDEHEVRSDIADYYYEVQRWDRDVGNALQVLEATGELDNTIIVMTGDNGFPFPRCKANLYDWGVREPLVIRWGARVKPGRRVTDFVSFTDFAPTFLEAAGVEIPKAMTGRSLLPILLADREGRLDERRDFVVVGRERHTPAQPAPSLAGYPSRALRTDKWLLILNLEPGRWPVGAPDNGGNCVIKNFADCDNSPTKSVIMEKRAGHERFYDLCFGKRPAVELYDCEGDPYQVQNLAGDPKHRGAVEKLRAQLVGYLKETGDPRFTDEPVPFDEFSYRNRKAAKK